MPTASANQELAAVARVEPRISPVSREAGPPPVQLRGNIYDELGRVHSVVVALNRELARKKAEGERLNAEINRQARHLEAADRRKNEFLAMLGHELRNPLAALNNALAVLGVNDPDPETVRWARDLMARQVRQMVRLVDDLFDLSRIMGRRASSNFARSGSSLRPSSPTPWKPPAPSSTPRGTN